jgi:hypothetical protein
MQTTYLLNTQELNMTFIRSLKSLLPNQDVEIRVSTVPSNNFIDEITLMAESSLADEWNSTEDQRWDNLL